MDKILSIQTIKNVFAALGAKTSDSNYGVALLDKTTAEPKGLMGMSDLASVLGVGQYRSYIKSNRSEGWCRVAYSNDSYMSFTIYCFDEYATASGGTYVIIGAIQSGYGEAKFVAQIGNPRISKIRTMKVGDKYYLDLYLNNSGGAVYILANGIMVNQITNNDASTGTQLGNDITITNLT